MSASNRSGRKCGSFDSRASTLHLFGGKVPALRFICMERSPMRDIQRVPPKPRLHVGDVTHRSKAAIERGESGMEEAENAEEVIPTFPNSNPASGE